MTDVPDEHNESIDLTGQTIGGYSILRRLGRGGMADVYLARQKSLERNVALKVLKPDLAKDDSYIQRFKREAQSAAKLVQSNIVGVYEVAICDESDDTTLANSFTGPPNRSNVTVIQCVFI